MSYTLRYGKTYEEWAEEKAERLCSILKYFYDKNEPIRLKEIAAYVYRERLTGISILKWKPINNRFLDFKPSPFIKNFLTYAIDQLKTAGYIATTYVVEVKDRVAVSDEVSTEKMRITGLKTVWKQVEVEDKVTVADPYVDKVIGRMIRSPVKIIEVRDTLKAEDIKLKYTTTRISYADYVIRLPSLKFIKELCYWKDPTI